MTKTISAFLLLLSLNIQVINAEISFGFYRWAGFPKRKLEPIQLANTTYDGVTKSNALKGHSKDIDAFLKYNESIIISGSRDKTIKVWQQNEEGEWSCFQTLTGHSSPIKDLLKIDENKIASASENEIKIWQKDEQARWHCIQNLPVDKMDTISLIRWNNGTFFSIEYKLLHQSNPSLNPCKVVLRIWKQDEKGTWYCAQILNEHTDKITCFMRLNKSSFATGSFDKSLKIWHRKGEGENFYCRKAIPCIGRLSRLLKLNNRGFATGSGDKAMQIWRAAGISEWHHMQDLEGDEGAGYGHRAFCLEKLSEHTFASGAIDSTIKIWKQHRPSEQRISRWYCDQTLIGHTSSVYSLIRLNESTFVSACYDMIKICQLDKEGVYRCIQTIKGFCGNNLTRLTDTSFSFSSGSEIKIVELV